MIVVDTSALIAILDREPDAALYAEAIVEADAPLISAATLLELHIVMLNRHGARAAQIVDRLIQDAGIQIENFTAQHLGLARAAYSRYSKGRNSAGSTTEIVFPTRWQRPPVCRCSSRGRIFQKRTCWQR